MTSFSIFSKSYTCRTVYLYLDIMTFYTLSPFPLMRVQAGVRLSFYFLVLLHAAYFWVFFSGQLLILK